MRSFSIAAVMFCSILTVHAQASKQAEPSADVLQVLKTYDNAWNKKDIARVDKILAPNYIYFNSEGGITTRKGTLDFLGSPKYKLTFVERSEMETYATGDTVIVSSRWKGKEPTTKTSSTTISAADLSLRSLVKSGNSLPSIAYRSVLNKKG